MVDWNVIRYITDKIGQGEEPVDIKHALVTNRYDMKLINESFTQAIPWLKQEQADKIKAMQAADRPEIKPAPAIRPIAPAAANPTTPTPLQSQPVKMQAATPPRIESETAVKGITGAALSQPAAAPKVFGLSALSWMIIAMIEAALIVIIGFSFV